MTRVVNVQCIPCTVLGHTRCDVEHGGKLGMHDTDVWYCRWW